MNVDRAIRRGTKLEAAVQVLLERLADGDWHLSAPVLAELNGRGLNAAVAHRAAHAIGVEHRKRTGPRFTLCPSSRSLEARSEPYEAPRIRML